LWATLHARKIKVTTGGKAALKMSMKLTPGVNFINVLCACFSYKILAPKITKLCFGFDILAPKILYEKCMPEEIETCCENLNKEKIQNCSLLVYIFCKKL
jgi:hypothetical protein